MYIDGFSDAEDVFSQFEVADTSGIEILVASYEGGGYEGSAYVLFKKDGKFYEVAAGHCSCYGLEGQWEPEETNVEALLHRMEEGTYFNRYESVVREEILKALVPPDPRWEEAERWAEIAAKTVKT